MESKPLFKRLGNGELLLGYTAEARRVAASNRTTAPPALSLSGDIVKKNAVSEVRQGGGDVADRLLVLAHHRIQFGAYRGETFKWLVENGLGYAAWMVDNLRGEKRVNTPLGDNKAAFKEYLLSFDEGREVVDAKERQRIRKKPAADSRSPPSQSKSRDRSSPSSVSPSSSQLSSLLVGRALSPGAIRSRLKQMKTTPPKAKSTGDTFSSITSYNHLYPHDDID